MKNIFKKEKKEQYSVIEILGTILIVGFIMMILFPIFTNALNNRKYDNIKNSLDNLVITLQRNCEKEPFTEVQEYNIKNNRFTPEVKVKGDFMNGQVFVDTDRKSVV